MRQRRLGAQMFTAKESTQLLGANQRLRALHIQKAKAQQAGNQAQADELQAEINELTD
jgi:hypothetical protein